MLGFEEVLRAYECFGNGVKWAHHFPEGDWIVTAVRQSEYEAEVHIVTNCDNKVLRWGIFDKHSRDQWIRPPEPLPLKTNIVNDHAAESSFIEDLLVFPGDVYSVQIKIFGIISIGGIVFVLRQGDKWYKNDSKNFYIDFK